MVKTRFMPTFDLYPVTIIVILCNTRILDCQGEAITIATKVLILYFYFLRIYNNVLSLVISPIRGGYWDTLEPLTQNTYRLSGIKRIPGGRVIGRDSQVSLAPNRMVRTRNPNRLEQSG